MAGTHPSFSRAAKALASRKQDDLEIEGGALGVRKPCRYLQFEKVGSCGAARRWWHGQAMARTYYSGDVDTMGDAVKSGRGHRSPHRCRVRGRHRGRISRPRGGGLGINGLALYVGCGAAELARVPVWIRLGWRAGFRFGAPVTMFGSADGPLTRIRKDPPGRRSRRNPPRHGPADRADPPPLPCRPAQGCGPGVGSCP